MIVLDFSQEAFDGGEIDPRPAFRPSGVRIGTPAMTTRGVKNDDMIQIVDFIDQAINNRNNPDLLKQIKEAVKNFALRFPLP